MSLKLYWNKVCPFVHRAWITALEKKAQVELVHVDLDNIPEWYKKINPRETVPCLGVGDKFVYESMFIARYFDETFQPINELNPGTADIKYSINFFIDEVGNAVGSMYDLLRAGVGTDAQKELEGSLERLEKLLVKQSAGPFFLGNTFSLADIALVPFLDRFSVTLSAYHGYDLFGTAPRLRMLYYAALVRPSVSSTAQPADFYISAYKSYANKERLTSGPRFYYSPFCPYAQRAWITLNLKGVKYEPVVIDLANKPANYVAEINPRGTVPVLDVGSKNFIYESSLIVDYVADKYAEQGVCLKYADSMAAANGRFFADDFGNACSGLFAVIWGDNEEAKVNGRKRLAEGLKRVDALLGRSSAGPFVFGGNISRADIIVIPFLIRIRALATHYQLTPLSAFPRLDELLKAALANQAIASTVQPDEKYVHFYLNH